MEEMPVRKETPSILVEEIPIGIVVTAVANTNGRSNGDTDDD